MATLRRGSRGDDVQHVQEQLVKAGYNIDTDGIFGGGTERAVKDFQQKNGLAADGLVGSGTRAALDKVAGGGSYTAVAKSSGGDKSLTEQDIKDVADDLNVEVPAIKAVYEVESRGKGFQSNGDPKILFEGHIFWRELKKRDINPENHVAGNENILHQKWTKDYYRENQYDRLNKAKKINEEAALASASWGTFQIMGFNYKACGYPSVKAFVDASYVSEGEHLKAFGGFVKSANLVRHLQSKDWAAFAKGYNGPGYAQNKYDEKLAAAYEKYKNA